MRATKGQSHIRIHSVDVVELLNEELLVIICGRTATIERYKGVVDGDGGVVLQRSSESSEAGTSSPRNFWGRAPSNCIPQTPATPA